MEKSNGSKLSAAIIGMSVGELECISIEIDAIKETRKTDTASSFMLWAMQNELAALRAKKYEDKQNG